MSVYLTYQRVTHRLISARSTLNTGRRQTTLGSFRNLPSLRFLTLFLRDMSWLVGLVLKMFNDG